GKAVGPHVWTISTGAETGRAGWHGPLEAHSIDRGQLVHSQWDEDVEFNLFAFSPDGRWAVGADLRRADAPMLRWADTQSGEASKLPLPPGDYQALTFCADGRSVILPALVRKPSPGRRLAVVDLEKGRLLGQLDADVSDRLATGGRRAFYPGADGLVV